MIQIAVPTGKYVVAVSGGIDSMVLLDVLADLSGLELVVAHFNHGIREDAGKDHQLVEAAAERYGLPFVSARGQLGSGASEATAREARYAFLHRVQREHGAQAIITAHHQDDVVETAIINIIRGTGRKGLSALGSNAQLTRPFINHTKNELREYASRKQSIVWRDDSTNDDERYLRNYVRRRIMPRIDAASRGRLIQHIETARRQNYEIDHLLAHDIAVHMSDGALERRWFAGLTHAVSCEVMAAWLRQQGVSNFNRGTIMRLTVAAKVSTAGKRINVVTGYWLEVGASDLQLVGQ
jgi:tRNA(Ile)-lysidine synthetase-like protein